MYLTILQGVVAVLAAAFVGVGLGLGAPAFPVATGVVAWGTALLLAAQRGRRSLVAMGGASVGVCALMLVAVRWWIGSP